MKKTISILLVVFLLSSFGMLFVSAADEVEYTQDKILVDNYGTYMSVKVFISEDETVLVPVDILSFCGGLYETSDNSDYIYYDGVQGIGYEKEIRISKKGNSGESVVYITPYESVTISSAKFSDSYVYENELYLPLTELLPFLDAKVEIKNDGILHIYPNPVSIFNAISYDNLDADIFSVDDVFAGGFVGATGYILDTIINLRFDRLDIVLNTGAVKDYNKLFEKLLTYNETYLSAFDAEKTPLDIVLDEMSNTLGDYNDFVESVDDSTKVTKAFFYIIDSDLFKNSKEFAKDMEGFKEFGTAVEGVYKTIQYFDAFNKQVDDHRNMLNAVYGGKYYSDSAKCNAANETALKYGGDTAGFVVSSVSSTLRDAIVKTGSGAISKSELLLPYKLTFDFLKFYRPEMKETLEDTSNMFYLDVIVSDSSTVAKELMASKSFDEKTLEDLRLSMIMALLTSKYAYEIYYDASLDYGESGLDVDWKYYKINEWLTRLYLASDSVECNTPEYYSKMKQELTSSVKYLKVCDNTVTDEEWYANMNATNFTLSYPTSGVAFDDCVITIKQSDDAMSYSSTENPVGIVTSNFMGIIKDGVRYELYQEKNGEWFGVALEWTIRTWRSYLYMDSLEFSFDDFVFDENRQAYISTAFEGFEAVFAFENGKLVSFESIDLDDPDNYIKVEFSNIGTTVIDVPNYRITSDEVSQGLEFALNDDGKSYSVTGIGICTDTNIVVPSMYNNLPVTSVGDSAFQACDSLTSVIIPDSVKSIGSVAFDECHSLENVIIGSSVTDIGFAAFRGTSIKYNEYNNAYYLGNDNNPYYALIQASDTSIKNCVINCNTRIVADFAFEYCFSLENIIIPDSVKSIGGGAFHLCTSLTSATIPDSVESIGVCAFDDCTSLQCNEYGNAYYLGSENNPYIILIKVKDESITSCEIPNTTKFINSSGAFWNCNSIRVNENNKYYKSIDGNLYSKDGTTLIQYAPGKQDASFIIPDSVTSIDGAFSYCTLLKNVTIGNSVTSIEDATFWGCYSLASVTIGNSVTNIGDYAFYSCLSLTRITIPDSVKSIGTGAFSVCSSLTSVTFENTEGWCCDNNVFVTDYILPSDLKEPATAAEYLTSIYSYQNWECVE